MWLNVIEGIAISFIGTALGSACVFFMKKELSRKVQRALTGFAAVLTILAAALIVPAMPYLLSFAAGAMMYIVVEELIPEMSQGEHSNIGVVMFSAGFMLMMALDVARG